MDVVRQSHAHENHDDQDGDEDAGRRAGRDYDLTSGQWDLKERKEIIFKLIKK